MRFMDGKESSAALVPTLQRFQRVLILMSFHGRITTKQKIRENDKDAKFKTELCLIHIF